MPWINKYIFAIFISSLVPIGGLRCLKCNDVISPRHCHNLQVCRNDEVCVVERFSSVNNENMFNLGCVADTNCHNTSNLIFNPDVNSDRVSSCVECCNSDLCNNRGCGEAGYPSHRGPVCYHCHQSRGMSKCDKISVCAENELCNVHGANIIGKRDALQTVCSSCCNGDLCNANCNTVNVNQSSVSKSTHTISTTTTEKTAATFEATTQQPFTQFKGHTGSSFWAAFPTVYSYYDRPGIHIKLVVISSSSVSTAISTATNTSYYLTDAVNKSMKLPYALIENYNTVEEKGLLVTTNTSASVFAFSAQSTDLSDMSWIPPSDRLGTSYIAVSYHPMSSYHSYINIVSVHSDTSINVTLNTTGIVTYNGQKYTSGDVVNLYLRRYQSFQITSTKDVSGSMIQSNRQIMVQSGMTEYRVGNTGGCVTAASIYLPPVQAWGQTFIVPPIDTAQRYVIRIVPSKQRTVLSVKGINEVHSYTLSSTLELNFEASEMLLIKCQYPCFVAQYPASESSANVTSYMVTIPAVEQYSRDYHVISPNFMKYKNNFISVMVESSEASGLLLNGTTVYSYNLNVQSITESNFTWSVLSIAIPEGVHMITHTSPHTVYGVIAYGFGRCNSYGYVAGLNI